MVPTSFPCNHLTTLPKVVAQSDKTLSLKIMFKEITFVLASLEGGPWILGHELVEHTLSHEFSTRLVQHEFCWTPFLWAFGYSVSHRASLELIFPLDFDPSKVGSDKFCWGRGALWLWNLHVPP